MYHPVAHVEAEVLDEQTKALDGQGTQVVLTVTKPLDVHKDAQVADELAQAVHTPFNG